MAALVCLWYFLLKQGHDQITQGNVDRIQEGTTLQQVSEILGPHTLIVDYQVVDSDGGVSIYRWEGIAGIAAVSFHNDGVSHKFFWPNSNTWWARVKSYFGL